MNAGYRRESMPSGFPASVLLFLNKPLFGLDLPRGVPGRRFRLGLLFCGGLLALGTLWGPSESREEMSLTPLVAELVPTLSLPVSMNERVDRWMERYLTDQRPAFERYLAREGLYSEMIRKALRARGMPEELFYLAAIESGFSPGATSRVSASGMWQFMGPTAQQFGLQIDEYVDERRDPVRATQAALDYLQALHERFDSWYLAAAAYNAGPGRVARALRSHSGDQAGEEELYWEIIEHLPRETRAYVPKMLALIVLGQAAEDYGFQVERADPVESDRVWVPGGTSLRWIASSVESPASHIRELNPHLIRGVTPPNGLFPVRIPPGTSPMLVASGGSRWRTVSVDD
jgi:membrane-bound lytic murein transglycosylase D